MKLNRKWMMVIALVMSLALATGGTLAYLTDKDGAVNVMTLGKVDIEQHEYQRVANGDGTYKTDTIDGQTSYVLEDFEQDKPLIPSAIPTNSTGWDWDSIPVRMSQVDSYGGMQTFVLASNAQDKFVTVENTGKTDAYVRTLVAVEIGSADVSLIGISYHQTWTKNSVGTVTIDGNKYYVYEFVYDGAQLSDGTWRHENGILPAGETTYPSFSQVYLHAETTNEDVEKIDGNGNDKLDILVLSQAVQAGGFDTAEAALTAGFGEATAANVQSWFAGMTDETVVDSSDALKDAVDAGSNVVVQSNVDVKDQIVLKGAILDGKNHEMTIGDADMGSDYDCVITTTGGTVQNMTITGNPDYSRAIGSGSTGTYKLTSDLVIKNVTIDKVMYAINGGGAADVNVSVSDSTIYGWVSFSGINSFNFTNCTLGKGNSYDGYFVVYGTTNFTNCNFKGVFDMGARAEAAGKTVTFTNCTYDGVPVTADNFEHYFYYGPGDETDFGRLMRECTIVVDGVTVDNSAW